MSSAINYILERICGQGAFDIPFEVLEAVFKDDWLDREMPTSLADRVYRNILRPRVFRDIELYYGEQILIDLNRAEYLTVGDYARVFRFAPEHTGNREIISADCIGFVPFGLYSNYQSASAISTLPVQNNELLNYGSQVMSSVSSVPAVSSTRVDIVGYNTVRVTDRQRFMSSYSLRCYVVNDSNLSNIPPQAWDKLLALCLLAVKAYCYQRFNILMGEVSLQRGQELGVFSDVIRDWKDAASEYYTYKNEEWAVQSYFMNDDQHHGLLQMMVTMGM